MSERQLFRKKKNTGMHQAVLSVGSVVNGETLNNSCRIVLRPGNTVLCIPRELGVMGLRQFDLVGGGSVNTAELQEQKLPPQKTLVIRPAKPGWYNVINPLNPDVPLNKKGLRKAAAEALLADLTEGEARSTIVDKFGDLSWNQLVAQIEAAGIEMDDEWETEDDLRQALRQNTNQGDE